MARTVDVVLSHASAIVLCGGRSTRMGRDKASLPFGDETLLDRTIRLLETVTSDIVVVAREGQVVPSAHQVVRDPVEGLGPLAGLAVGLRAIRGDRAFVAACDMPFLRPSLVERVIALSDGYEAAVPHIGGVLMTTCAVYGRGLAERADELIALGRRRLVDLVEHAHARLISDVELRAVDRTLESFRNCNTPDEYLAALRAAGGR